MIQAHRNRAVAIHLTGGSVVRGRVVEIDKDQDGFIEITLDSDHGRIRFVTPVDQIVAYEVADAT
ncbi:MAG: hypothetical protein HUU22_11500 [Phycisphaerae bacterium]|nr:hypothetical protein [Phycisphaerae bacterium]